MIPILVSARSLRLTAGGDSGADPEGYFSADPRLEQAEEGGSNGERRHRSHASTCNVPDWAFGCG